MAWYLIKHKDNFTFTYFKLQARNVLYMYISIRGCFLNKSLNSYGEENLSKYLASVVLPNSCYHL
jgi:hypothetical protein